MEELTQKEIEEGNLLLNKYAKGYIDLGYAANEYNHALSYNNSWDWIMPILKQIEEQGCIVEITMSVVVMCRICVINGKHRPASNIIHDNNGGLSPIVPLFRAAVEYVKYRNSNIN